MSKKKSKKTSNFKKKQIIYGAHAVLAALNNNKRIHEELLISESHRDIIENFGSKLKKITILERRNFKKIFGDEKTTQGIVLKTYDFERPNLEEFLSNEKLSKNSVLLALDQITDPQNIGSIMRSCALFNCKGILIAKNHAPDLTPSLFKAASGAVEIVNYFRVTNLKRTILELKKYGYWVYGFDSSNSQNFSEINFSDSASIQLIESQILTVVLAGGFSLSRDRGQSKRCDSACLHGWKGFCPGRDGIHHLRQEAQRDGLPGCGNSFSA